MFWDTEKNEAPITTGRFFISDTTGSTIILEKNENWWNIENEDFIINKITINFYSSVAGQSNCMTYVIIRYTKTTDTV